MSRSEIEAATNELRKAARRRMHSESFADAWVPAPGYSLVSNCADQVRAEPTFRAWLVTELQHGIEAGTYTRPAEAIADQLLGRLVAAALPT